MRTLITYGCLLGMLLTALASQSRADLLTYVTQLNGANENPSHVTPGTGFADVFIDTVAQTMEVDVTFSGLLGGVSASHIHCCIALGGNAGVATTTPTFTGFPSGVTSGTYDHVFDLTQASSYNPAFVTAEGSLANAEAALLAGLAGDQAYLNIHSAVFPGGEIRGFLVAAPEPASLPVLVVLLVVGAVVVRRRRTA
jgi:hypothetical protein